MICAHTIMTRNSYGDIVRIGVYGDKRRDVIKKGVL